MHRNVSIPYLDASAFRSEAAHSRASMNKIRVAVITRYFPSSAEPWQGRAAYQTLRALARHAEVKVFFPNAAYPKAFTPRSRMYRDLDPHFSPPEVAVSYFDFPALPLVSRPFNGWMAARTVMPHVRAFDPDLVFGYFLYPDSYAALKVGRALGIPVAAMSMGSDINRIRDPITALHTRTVLRNVDAIFAKSDDLRQKALDMGASPDKCRTVSNGCDLSVFRIRDRAEARRMLNIAPDGEVVVYIGRLDTNKGLRELVGAAVSLRAARPNLHVYLVGEGPDRARIRNVIEVANATHWFRIQGACPPDEVPFWIAASNLITLPSYMEGCPNVVLEALACGRPVVATNVGGIPEILNEECGRLAPARNPDALAQALGWVLEKKWDESAISASRSRGWDRVAAELLEVFDSLVWAHSSRKEC